MVSFLGTKKALADACAKIREELDDHLDAINSGSHELGEVREIVGVLDDKIERLNARLDEIYLLLGAESGFSEQERVAQVFLQTARSLEEVTAFCGGSVASAERLLKSLHFKGAHVFRMVEQGVVRYTTNAASTKHVSLNSYL